MPNFESHAAGNDELADKRAIELEQAKNRALLDQEEKRVKKELEEAGLGGVYQFGGEAIETEENGNSEEEQERAA